MCEGWRQEWCAGASPQRAPPALPSRRASQHHSARMRKRAPDLLDKVHHQHGGVAEDVDLCDGGAQVAVYAHQLQRGGVPLDLVQEPLQVGVADAKLGAGKAGGHVGVHLRGVAGQRGGGGGGSVSAPVAQPARTCLAPPACAFHARGVRRAGNTHSRARTPCAPSPPSPLPPPLPLLAWGSTSGLMRMSTRAGLPTARAAARMFSRSNSESMLTSAPWDTANSRSAGCLPLPLKMVL